MLRGDESRTRASGSSAWLRDLLEEEVTQFLGRGRSERRAAVGESCGGYRNGIAQRRPRNADHKKIRCRYGINYIVPKLG